MPRREGEGGAGRNPNPNTNPNPNPYLEGQREFLPFRIGLGSKLGLRLGLGSGIAGRFLSSAALGVCEPPRLKTGGEGEGLGLSGAAGRPGCRV